MKLEQKVSGPRHEMHQSDPTWSPKKEKHCYGWKTFVSVKRIETAVSLLRSQDLMELHYLVVSLSACMSSDSID
mgnify:CR=1 FL=1